MKADSERIEQRLMDLVSIASITGDEDEAVERLAAMALEIGFDVSTDRYDVADLKDHDAFPGIEVPRTGPMTVVTASFDTGRPGSDVILLGHLDVVPPGAPDTWTSPAFQPEVRDGLLYGRGACDMKGGIVSMLEAFELLDRSSLTGSITLVGVPSEEDGGAGAFAAIDAGLSGDVCVIAEPTDLEIVVAHAGAITFTVEIPGRAAHASTRLEGVSALQGLQVVLRALEEDEHLRNEAETDPQMRALGLPYPTIIGMAQGGNWPSSVMDELTIHGRYGVKLGQDCFQATEDLEVAIRRAWESDEWLSQHPLSLRVWGGRFDSSRIDPDHALPVSLVDASERAAGRTPERVGAPFGADMRQLINLAGIPTVMYGPGTVRAAHSADEHVSLADVATCAEVLAEWVASGAGVADW